MRIAIKTEVTLNVKPEDDSFWKRGYQFTRITLVTTPTTSTTNK